MENTAHALTTYAVHLVELPGENDPGRWADVSATDEHAAIEAAVRSAHLVGYGTGRLLARVYDQRGLDRLPLHRREFAGVAVCPGCGRPNLDAGEDEGPREYHADCWSS